MRYIQVFSDGHNRYEICERFRIPFKTVQKDFKDRNEAMLWMMHNQLARRNLNDFQRVEVTHKCEEAVKAKAEERMLAGLKVDPSVNLRKGRASDELGSMAGVSASTYEHAVDVIEKAPKPVVDAARKNDLSIHTAYQVTKMEPEEQEALLSHFPCRLYVVAAGNVSGKKVCEHFIFSKTQKGHTQTSHFS